MAPENIRPEQDEASYESVSTEPPKHLDVKRSTIGNDLKILYLESKMHPTSADGEVITGPAVSDHAQPLDASLAACADGCSVVARRCCIWRLHSLHSFSTDPDATSILHA